MFGDFAELERLLRSGRMELRSDSRNVAEGDVFVAIPGEKVDGLQFVPEAVKAGASVVVCSENSAASAGAMVEASGKSGSCRIVAHPDPREALGVLAKARWNSDRLPLTIVGITGTNGKTTCSYLLEHLFTGLGEKTGVIGTISYRWPGHVQAAPLTTPDARSLHCMLSQMASAGVRKVIMEVSSHSIAQHRVSGISFSAAAFTNLTQDHLDFHEDMESYFNVKSRLFAALPSSDKVCAINTDDRWGKRLVANCGNLWSFGFSGASPTRNHLDCEIVELGISGCHIRMRHAGRHWELRSPLVGEFNIHNLLTAQAVALGLGYAPTDLAQLGRFNGVCGRTERIENPAGLHVFVDYAHTPDALENVLGTMRKAGFKKLVVVFGCGGNRDRAKRPLMGEAVARYSDVAVLTSDNPRFENAGDIIKDVLPGLAAAREVHIEPDRRNATRLALEMIGPEDALVIAGKGHEDYQIVNGVRHHYSDQETVRELLHCA